MQQRQQPRKQIHTLHSKWKPYLFLAPSLLGVGAFVLIPFLDVARRSFLTAMGDSFVGIENYKTVIENEAFQLAARNTARFLFTCIPLLMVISLGTAVMVYGLKWMKELVKTIFLFPMAVPIASIVVLWRLVFDQNGYLNGFLSMMNLQTTDWMNSSSAFYVLVGSYLWKNTGYDMILWLTGLSGISDSLYEAAKIDGAGRWQCFRYITAPLLKPSAVMIGVLSLVNSFKVFREAYLIAGDYPHKSIYMLQHLFNNWFVSLDMQKMSAASVMLALLTAMIIIGVHKNHETE